MSTAPLERLLISGASSEIGAALARALGGRCRLVLGGRDRQRLEQVRASCAQPAAHALWAQDLEQLDAIGASLEREVVPGGPISHFVHLAGVARPGALGGLRPAAVSGVFAVNALSAIEIVRVLAQKRINAERLAGVLAVSSIAVDRGARGFAAYAASKSALESFVRSIATELGRPVDAAVLRLPEVRVDRSSGAGTSLLQQEADRTRWPGAQDAADALLRLLQGAEGALRGETFTLRPTGESFAMERNTP